MVAVQDERKQGMLEYSKGVQNYTTNMADDVAELKCELYFDKEKGKTIHQELNEVFPFIPEFAKLKKEDNVESAYFQCDFLFNL